MEVLLIVLSVLGSVLLWVLRILLVLLVLILFLLLCPIRYRVRTSFGEKWFAEGRVSYLLSAFSVKAVYEDGKLQSSVHLFGMDVFRVLEWWKKRRAAARKRKREKTGQREAYRKKEQSEADLARTEEKAELAMTEKERESPQELITESVIEEKEEKRHFWKKGSEALRMAREKWKRLRHFFAEVRRLPGRLCRGAEQIKKVRAFLKLENTKQMVCIFKDNVLHLWRKLRPRVIRGEVLFGTGDPCLTGQIFGAAAMLYAAYGKDVRVTPDFEEEILEGNLLIKGHISVMTLLVIAMRIFFSSEWDRFRRDIGQVKEAM